jgi:hypothetical protein
MKQKITKYKSHIAALAVIALVLVVPVGAAAFADGLNDTIGGGRPVKFLIDSQDDLTDKTALRGSTFNTIYAAKVLYEHKNSADVAQYDKQTFLSAAETGDANTVVISAADATQSTVRYNALKFNLPFSPNSMMESGSDVLALTISSASDKTLIIKSAASWQPSGPSDGSSYTVCFWGLKDGKMSGYVVPLTFPSDLNVNATQGYYDEAKTQYVMNITAEPQTYYAQIDKADIVKAATALSGSIAYSTQFTVNNYGNTDVESIVPGDLYEFDIQVLGENVNGFSVANIFMGLSGCCMMVGAIFSTPFVNLSDVMSVSQKARSKYRKKGRR